MGEIGRRRFGDPVDLLADRCKTVLDADDDALNLLGAFAGVFGPKRGVAARADQMADLTVEIANGFADQMGRLPRRFGEVLHLAGDDRKASSRGAGAGGLDGRIQCKQVGLPGDGLDRSGYLGDLRERRSDRTARDAPAILWLAETIVSAVF